MSNIIITADLSIYTGKTLVGPIADSVVATVNKWIDVRTHRVWNVGNAPISVVERYDWKSPLWLRHMDVVAIQTVKLGYPNLSQQTIAPGGYFVNPEGRLTMYFSYSAGISVRNNDLLEITYTYGAQTVPDDLKQAALAIAARLYNYATNDGKDIVSTSVGGYRVESIQAIRGTSGENTNPGNNTADLLFAVVDSYKMTRF
jgi:hypothetical protein